MPQIINTNVASLNSQRNLDRSQSDLGVSLQRLSSGLRINSARDDAAGLAISERFTTQIRGINQAIRNSNDGVSLAQTAEGDLAQITNNLQRIRELAVQSANATNSTSDRAALQLEVTQLISEIDRVASTSAFNGVQLLDGSFSSQLFQVGANAGETVAIENISSSRTDALGQTFGATATNTQDIDASYANGDLSINGSAINATADAKAIADAINALDPNLSTTVTNVQTAITFNDVNGNASELTAGANATPGVTTLGAAITNFDFAGGDAASFLVDGATTVTLDQSYGTADGVRAAIQNQLGGNYSVTENAGVISIATTATGTAATAPVVNTFNGNSDGGDTDGVVTDFSAGSVTTPGEDVVNNTSGSAGAFSTVTLGAGETYSITLNDGATNFTLFTETDGGGGGATVTAGELDTALATADANSDNVLSAAETGLAFDIAYTGTPGTNDLAFSSVPTVGALNDFSVVVVNEPAANGFAGANFATGTNAINNGNSPVAEVFTAGIPSTVTDFSVDQVSFTIGDGTQTTDITLTADYTDLNGVAAAINAQITADGTPADVTASIDGSNRLVFTSNTPSDVTIAVTAYDGNTDGNVGTQADFVGTPTTLNGADAATYNLTIDGTALDLSGVGANGNITAAEIAGLINALDGYSATTSGATSLDITKADGSNIVLSETGSDSVGTEGLAGGTGAANATTYYGQITSISNANGVLEIAGNNVDNAGDDFNAGTVAVDTGTALGTTITDTDVSTVAGANAALLSVDSALTAISTSRSSLGAIQNRFESVVSSLSTSVENLSAARSRIRDADFAAETAALTRNQILQQAGVSILSQANALPQLALSLLQ